MKEVFMLKVLFIIIVPFWILILIVWRLFTLLLMIISLPILFFLPPEIMQNFDQIVNRIALKTLRFIWRVIKCSFFIMFGLVLIPLTPILIFGARLCGNLWAWVVTGGKPTLETKKLAYSVLGVFGFFLMIIFGILGLVICCFSGESLASLIGGVGGFIIWLYPTVDCFDLEKKIEKELNSANRPYNFVDSPASREVLFTVDSSAPPLASSESGCSGNDSKSRPAI